MTLSRGSFACAALLFAASCGGGDGGGAPAPTPNRPPTITSGTTISVAENVAGTIYTATATDPDGNALIFSLIGGADQARFHITPGGALSFLTPPDFEAPADADRNNIYFSQISVSDGSLSTSIVLEVTVTNGPDGAFTVRRVGAGFSQPLFVAPHPDGSARVLVLEKAGRIRILTPATGAIGATMLDLAGTISTDGERGLLGFAAAPNFAASGLIYVHVTAPDGSIEIRRYRVTGDAADPASADVVLRVPHPRSNHNGGWIDFGPDGFLYIAMGDGGGGGDPDDNGQNRATLLGKILRIDVSSDAFPADAARDYTIPPNNPFANSGGAPEVWAFGLRNPFRNSFDRTTGNLLIGDVGQNLVEEIDLMRPGDGGANFGWVALEGTRPFRGPIPPGAVAPVTEYDHGSGPRQGNSVTGGYVYRGPVEALQGRYIFGDFVSGNIWSLPVTRFSVGSTVSSSEFELRNAAFTPNADTIGNVASFGIDAAQNLYIVDFDGEIFRIEPQ